MRMFLLALFSLGAVSAFAQQLHVGETVLKALPPIDGKGVYLDAGNGVIYELSKAEISFYSLGGSRKDPELLVDFGGPACVWRVGMDKRLRVSSCIDLKMVGVTLPGGDGLTDVHSVLVHPTGTPASAVDFRFDRKAEDLRSFTVTRTNGQRVLPIRLNFWFEIAGEMKVYVTHANVLTAPIGIR